jgi:3-hydroxyacyl-CoA dehydrogenase/enoyl-CoA hydratase/3-hydroxybutyryl-CoA epimerase
MTAAVTHSVDPDGVGWIVFDDPSSAVNVFNIAAFDALDAAITALTSPAVKAVVVVSSKERIFIAGADLKWLMGLPDGELAEEFSRSGQHIFQRLDTMLVPVVCAIDGACAGGGFELALACHWRIASSSLATQIGLPETGIGTIPGWGGCVRLPMLIGVEGALDHILRAQLVPADEALRSGLVDEVVPPAGLWARAKEAALGLAASGLPTRPSHKAPTAAYFAELRESVRKKTRGQLPAPLAAINVVEQGSKFDIGFALAVEAVAFGQVTAGAVCKNLVNGFFLREAARKRTLEGWFPAAASKPAPVRRVGIVGAGVMGSGIAQWLAARGFEVVLRDVLPEFVERALEVIHGLFEDGVKRGRQSAGDARDGFARISSTTAWDGFDKCDVVIEAIVENVKSKQRLFSEIAGIVRPDTLLASNSSALPIEEIAGHVRHPERTIGIHFFNPVGRMALVELVLGRHTSAAAAERALAFVKAVGKSPVICRSSPGFLVTRVLFFYLNEAVRLWEEGMPTASLDSAMRDFGWPMGPLRLIDEVGVDVTDFIFGELERYYPKRFVPSRTCAAMLPARLRGRKNGASSGFYSYAGGAETLNDEATRSLARPVGAPASNPRETVARLMGVMIAEAKRCLDERVVLTQDDVDFALVAGAGFPAFRGGLMRYAHRAGGSSAPFL